jgi:hypothetical protein
MIPLDDHELQEAMKAIYKANGWLMEIGEASIVYVAGPMTGIEDFNRRAFWIMEHCLKLRRCRVLSPAHYDDLDLPYEWYMRRGLQMVLDANTLVMLNGWSGSKGANIEHRVATAVGNKIYYKDNEKAFPKGK